MRQLLQKLITFESDKNHPEEIKKCFDFVTGYLRESGIKVKTYQSHGKLSLIASRTLKKHYQYILCGHLDVVPANYKNAFKPMIRGSRLYGRGASDMKGVNSAMIKLLLDKSLKNTDLALMLTGDEEVGGFDGINYLLNKKSYGCDCVIVPDGGTSFNLVLAEKAVMLIKITSKGKAAHGSRPWLGENAIEKLVLIYQEIKNNMPKADKKNFWEPTVNLGKLNSGDAANKVPSSAEMFLDFRYPKKEQKNMILNLIKKAVIKQLKTNYQIETEGELMTTPKNNPYIKKIINTAKKQGINLKIKKECGASDGRFFSSQGIPVLMFAPKASNAHIDNEWIDLNSLDKFYHLLKSFLLNN